MFSSPIRRGVLTAFAALALPSALLAQESVAPPEQSTLPEQEEVQGWLSEIQEIHGKLESIQRQALQDPELVAAQDALGASIKSAMEAADPTLELAMARVPLLEGEAQAAQTAGDQEKLQALSAEAEQIQRQFAAAQQQALQQPGLAAQVDAFQQQLEQKMAELDPAAGQLISRFKELESKLATMLQGAGTGG